MSQSTTIDAGPSSTSGHITTAVIEGIADVSGQDPIELDLCLSDYIDPDALDMLFSQSTKKSAALELTATIESYDVIVHSSGRVTVSERPEAIQQPETAVSTQ